MKRVNRKRRRRPCGGVGAAARACPAQPAPTCDATRKASSVTSYGTLLIVRLRAARSVAQIAPLPRGEMDQQPKPRQSKLSPMKELLDVHTQLRHESSGLRLQLAAKQVR